MHTAIQQRKLHAHKEPKPWGGWVGGGGGHLFAGEGGGLRGIAAVPIHPCMVAKLTVPWHDRQSVAHHSFACF